jgi:hypothetical protein
MYAGLLSSFGYTCSRKFNIFVGDSAFANFAHAMTTPQGAQIVSTQ